MPLMPKRVKYRKSQRGSRRGKATRGNSVVFGEYGLQSLQRGWIDGKQIEAARVAGGRVLRGEGRYWIRIFPHKAVSKKPLETRMGKGKGEIDKWVAVVKPGTVLFEIGGVDEDVAKDAFRKQAAKLPLKVKMIKRRHGA